MYIVFIGFVLKYLESYRSMYLLKILNLNFLIKKMYLFLGFVLMFNIVFWIRIRGINILKYCVFFCLKMEI